MSLKLTAVADAKFIVEDTAAFAWPVTITSPLGVSATLNGLSKDIAAMIDPATGVVVSGRVASVTLQMDSLIAAGFGLPKNVADKSSKPWVVSFNDTVGVLQTFKVSDSLPDSTLRVVVLKLEAYKPAP